MWYRHAITLNNLLVFLPLDLVNTIIEASEIHFGNEIGKSGGIVVVCVVDIILV